MMKTKLKFYTGNIVPEENTIFVFGSNTDGVHGAGSAACAMRYFGAIYGQAEGLQGESYALPTTLLYSILMSPKEITEHIKKMYDCARENPDKNFKVAYRNKPNERTLCGYTGADLQKCFKDAGPIPENVWFSKEWVDSGNLE